jgi:hypothetical protein
MNKGYLAFVQYPTVHPLLTQYNLGSRYSEAKHAFILNRQERKLTVASRKYPQIFLAQQWPKAEPVHLTREEWEALKTRIIAEMKQKQQNRDIEEIHRYIEEQFALVEALQNWLDQYLTNESYPLFVVSSYLEQAFILSNEQPRFQHSTCMFFW